MVNPSGVRFTSEQRGKLRLAAVKRYTEGASVKEVAETIGCSAATVTKFLVESATPLRPSRGQRVDLPDGMLTTAQAAALIGVSAQSLNAMHYRGDSPPRAETPIGAHSYYGHYWRTDVDQWLTDRANRRLERARTRETAKGEHARALAANLTPEHAPNWELLVAACDARREAGQLSWADVSHLTGVDASQISRIRSGRAPAKAAGSFFRLALWALGSVPVELKPFMRLVAGKGEAAA